jgi:hypothetical protein
MSFLFSKTGAFRLISKRKPGMNEGKLIKPIWDRISYRETSNSVDVTTM